MKTIYPHTAEKYDDTASNASDAHRSLIESEVTRATQPAIMKLSIIMPVYNEVATIAEIIKRVMAVDLNKELIIVDDGSVDGTREILRNFSPVAKIIFHDGNRGKGAAIRTGLERATGDIVLIQDADLEYDPNDYHALVQPIVDGKTPVVYGSRILRRENPRSNVKFYIAGRFLSLVTNLLYGIHITDEPTCYKVFRRDLLKSLDLQCEGFEFCPEVTAKIAARRILIHEVPIRYMPRSVAEGKKINWKDGLQALWTLLKYRLRR